MAESDFATFSFDLSRPPEFLHCGRFVGRAGWTHARRTLGDWELLLGLEGRVFLFEGDTNFVLGPGDVLLFQPGATHGGLAPLEAGASFQWMHFNPRPLGGEGGAVVALPQFSTGLPTGRLRLALQQLTDAAYGGSRWPAARDHLCALALYEYAEALAASPAAPGPDLPWLHALVAWVDVHLHEPLTVAHLARQSGRNPDYLNRVFRRYLGSTVLSWLHHRKMDRARERLITSDAPVKQIAAELGFADLRQFYRVFQRTWSSAPSEYRRAYPHTWWNDH